ncbi:hypothetical protein [Streptomyces sp. NRRL F-5755]|uniref:hypothetical protein n=1 Tax=Streptomyces sp. NRRL F-5755 TaxID=1519475 RepID=UPI000B107A77|nr:hypothetical protein [Streptomyces sp. NRRL F-5755]
MAAASAMVSAALWLLSTVEGPPGSSRTLINACYGFAGPWRSGLPYTPHRTKRPGTPRG